MSTQRWQAEHENVVPDKETATAPVDEEVKYDPFDAANRYNPTRSVLSPTSAPDKSLDQPTKSLDQDKNLDNPPSLVRLESAPINLPNGNTAQVTNVRTTNPNLEQQQNTTDLAQQATTALTALSSLYTLYNQYKGSQATSTPNPPTPSNDQNSAFLNQTLAAYNSVKQLTNSGVTHLDTTTTVTNPQSVVDAPFPVEQSGQNEIVHNIPSTTSQGGPQQQGHSIDLQGVMSMLGGLLNTNNTTTANQSQQTPGNTNLANIISLLSTVGPLLASGATNLSSTQNPTTSTTAPVQDTVNNTNTPAQSNNLLSTLGALASTWASQNAVNQQQQQQPPSQQQQQQGHQPSNTSTASTDIASTLQNLSQGFQGLSQLSKMFGK